MEIAQLHSALEGMHKELTGNCRKLRTKAQWLDKARTCIVPVTLNAGHYIKISTQQSTEAQAQFRMDRTHDICCYEVGRGDFCRGPLESQKAYGGRVAVNALSDTAVTRGTFRRPHGTGGIPRRIAAGRSEIIRCPYEGRAV